MSLDPEIAANDKLAETYFDIWQGNPTQRLTHRIEALWINNLVRKGDKILLAGSGGGRELDLLLDRAAAVVAVDISARMLEVGKAKFPQDKISWQVQDIQHLDPILGGFDIALALGGVFAYLREPLRAAKCLHKALNPSGTIVLSVMNALHPTELGKQDEKPSGRYRHPYTQDEISSVLMEAGFQNVEVKGYRFLVDHLPTSWNTPEHSSGEIGDVLHQLADLEEKLIQLAPADSAKMLWVTGTK